LINPEDAPHSIRMITRLLLASLLSFALAVHGEDFEERTFSSADGAKLPYRLLKPFNYDAQKKYPLVLFLHGAGERGADNKVQLKHGVPAFVKAEAREKYPCFIVAPQCPKDKRWVEMDWGGTGGTAPEDPGPTQPLVLGMLDALKGEFSIDEDRLYVTGLSMGGYGTWDLITRHPDKWAAAVPVCGGGDRAKASAAKPVPVWAFHGLADNVVLPVRSREMVAALKSAGGAAYLTEYPGVQHDSWTSAYSEPNLLPWLFAQQRGVKAQKRELATSRFTALALPPENVFPGTGALQMAPWFQKLWMLRRTEFARSKDAEQRAVVFFGDSITQGWSTLAKDFPRLRATNRGISGDTSRGLRYRMKEDVLDLHPRAVSILVGTNDLALGGTPEQVIENLKAIVAEIHKQDRNVPVILNLVMPRGAQPGRFPELIVKLNGMITNLAKKENRIFICDTWSIFEDGNGICKKEEFPDMLHPNKAGYAKWKAALDEVFEDLKL
jgi:poly(3-hydroxybutyrate) depolymerase/lysophospholipase L1-like esterase